jgi:hypothetical protein
MKSRRQPGRKESRRPKQRAQDAPPKFVSHPLYGKVPLVPTGDGTDRTQALYQWDPDYQPPMPRGAVKGNIRKQNLHYPWHMPKYFYVDEHRTCIQCEEDFLFGAAEQQFWYEALRFYGKIVPIRCLKCRRKKRTESAVNSQLSAAKTALKKNPRDPALLLALAEGIILLCEMTGHGKLSEATTAAREARKLDSNAHEALFWEACAHRLGGRHEKARRLFAEFSTLAVRSRKQQDLQRKAKEYLAE